MAWNSDEYATRKSLEIPPKPPRQVGLKNRFASCKRRINKNKKNYFHVVLSTYSTKPQTHYRCLIYIFLLSLRFISGLFMLHLTIRSPWLSLVLPFFCFLLCVKPLKSAKRRQVDVSEGKINELAARNELKMRTESNRLNIS